MNPYGAFGAHTYWRLYLYVDTYLNTFRLFNNLEGTEPALHVSEGYTATSSGGDATTRANVLDLDPTTYWRTFSASQWFKFEFDTPQEVLSARINENHGTDFILQYSDNDSTWTTALEVADSWFNQREWSDSFNGLDFAFELGSTHVKSILESKQARPMVASLGSRVESANSKDIQLVDSLMETSYDLPATPLDAADFGMMQWQYSGGATNADEADSLGGMLSSVAISYQNFHIPDPVSGITIERLVFSEISWGILTFRKLSTGGFYFEWVPSGIQEGAGQTISSSGKATILSGGSIDEGYIQIAVDVTLLPDNGEVVVYVANQPGNIFTKVGEAEAEVGSVIYRGVYIHNSHPSKVYRALTLFIEHPFPDDQVLLEIGLESSPLQIIANETTAPAGVSFSVPSKVSPLSVGNIAPGYLVGVWLKRTVVSNCDLNNYNLVSRISMDGRYA